MRPITTKRPLLGPKIWGYARSSHDESLESVEMQAGRIEDLAVKLSERGEFAGIEKEHVSASTVRWNKRHGFKQLMHKMERGDTLIVWKLDRLDRNFWGMFDCVRYLVGMDIKLYALTVPGGGELDLSTAIGRSLLVILAIFQDMWVQNHVDTCKATRKRLIGQGRYTGGKVPYGHRIVTRQGTRYKYKKGESIPVKGKLKYIEWDPVECAQILELVARRRTGETLSSIAGDWNARDLTRACGQRWVTKSGAYGQELTHQALVKAYKWAEAIIRDSDEGTLNGLPVPPSTFRASSSESESPEDPPETPVGPVPDPPEECS